jgi:hypothetical protein
MIAAIVLVLAGLALTSPAEPAATARVSFRM